jgi:hypothetical protein
VSVALDDVLARIQGLAPEAKQDLLTDIMARTASKKFIPSPGPQTEAWFSKADVLLYGGAAGGGKTALLIGLALEEHSRSLLMRRNMVDMEGGGGLIEELLRINGSRDGFSGKSPPTLRSPDGRIITFGAASNLGDEMKYQGRPRDLLGVDEATHFAESQIRFLMGWVRSEEEGQRKRTVLATNPPIDNTGDWIIGMFRPWLDLTHPNPAKPGELRWYVTDPDGKEMEVASSAPVEMDGRKVTPESRTFIPASLMDNPFLAGTGYDAKLDAMPEPLRSAMRDGNFMLARDDDAFQVIPTQWIREAQARWTPEPPSHAPMSAVAADVAQGGSDNTVLSTRYDNWFAPLEVIPGVETPTGNEVAGLIISKRRNGAMVIIDMGGGYGGATLMRLKDNEITPITGHKGAEASVRRTADNQLGFFNKRAEITWRLREALDPAQDGGSTLALPDDPELVSDLTADRFEITSRGIKITSKEDVCKVLGRSPDKGDAVKMANAYGPSLMTHGNQWRKFAGQSSSKAKVTVNMGHSAARRRR